MAEKSVRSPKVLIGLGVVFLALGLLAVPWVLNDISSTTGRGIPIWFASIGLTAGGLYFIGLGWFHARKADRSDAS